MNWNMIVITDTLMKHSCFNLSKNMHRRRAHCRADFASGVYNNSCRSTLKRPSFIQCNFGTLLGNPHENSRDPAGSRTQEKYSKFNATGMVRRDWLYAMTFHPIIAHAVCNRSMFTIEICTMKTEFLNCQIYKFDIRPRKNEKKISVVILLWLAKTWNCLYWFGARV